MMTFCDSALSHVRQRKCQCFGLLYDLERPIEVGHPDQWIDS